MAKGKKLCKSCNTENGCRALKCKNCGVSFGLEPMKYTSKASIQSVEENDVVQSEENEEISVS